MAPTLLPGDWALAVPVRKISKGHVVVIEHPDRPGYEMVKRVTALPGDVVSASAVSDEPARLMMRDEFWVQGDAPAGSTDSRSFGPVSRKFVKARLLLIYRPAERRRLLRT